MKRCWRLCGPLLLGACGVRGGRPDRGPPRDDFGTSRTRHRPRALRDRSDPSRQPRHRRPRSGATKCSREGRILIRCAVLQAEGGRARGTVFLEAVNRGRDQSLEIMSGARQRDLSPDSWNLGDRFLLEQGFAVAFLGWQFDVARSQGLTFRAGIAPVEGLVRESYIELVAANGSSTSRSSIAPPVRVGTQRDADVSHEHGRRAPAACPRRLAICERRMLARIERRPRASESTR